MIKENETKLNTVLTDLVTDKFGYYNSCDPKAHCNQERGGKACTIAGTDCGYGLTCKEVQNIYGDKNESEFLCVGTKDSTGKWCAENPKE